MYRFTNGIVVYDEETRDKYIKAGMTLVKEENKVENKTISTEPSTECRDIKKPTKFFRR